MNKLDVALASMLKGGRRKKAKGLPKRHSNPAKKARHKRCWERGQARKRRHTLRDHGSTALKAWDLRHGEQG